MHVFTCWFSYLYSKDNACIKRNRGPTKAAYVFLCSTIVPSVHLCTKQMSFYVAGSLCSVICTCSNILQDKPGFSGCSFHFNSIYLIVDLNCEKGFLLQRSNGQFIWFRFPLATIASITAFAGDKTFSIELEAKYLILLLETYLCGLVMGVCWTIK